MTPELEALKQSITKEIEKIGTSIFFMDGGNLELLNGVLNSFDESRLSTTVAEEVGLAVVAEISQTLSEAFKFGPYGTGPQETLRELFISRLGYEVDDASLRNCVEGLSKFGTYYKEAMKARGLLINGYESKQGSWKTALRDRQLGVYKEALIADSNGIGANVLECMFKQFLVNIDSGIHKGLDAHIETGQKGLREGFNIGWDIFHKAKDMVTQIQTGQRYYSI